jgi:hypothetical protein
MTGVEIESVRETADAGATPPERNGAPPTREVRHEYTGTFRSGFLGRQEGSRRLCSFVCRAHVYMLFHGLPREL